MIKKAIALFCLLFISTILVSCAVADNILDGIDKMQYPEFYVDHQAYLVNGLPVDVEVKIIDIYQQKLIAHHFIQPKVKYKDNKKSSPWVVPLTIRLGTYRIMVFTQDGNHNGYQSFPVSEVDFINKDSCPVWVITRKPKGRLKVIQSVYRTK